MQPAGRFRRKQDLCGFLEKILDRRIDVGGGQKALAGASQ